MVVRINHVNSKTNDKLQAVDLISGAIFQKVENNNEEYELIIKDKIRLFKNITKEITK